MNKYSTGINRYHTCIFTPVYMMV